jgi:hypothetical protein
MVKPAQTAMHRDLANNRDSMLPFLRAVSDATEKLNGLGTKLNGLTKMTESASQGMQNLIHNAARVGPMSQALATHCQCECKCAVNDGLASTDWNTKWPNIKGLLAALGIYFSGGKIFQHGELWFDLFRGGWAYSKPILNGMWSLVRPLLRMDAELEIFELIAAAGTIVAGLLVPEVLIPALVATASNVAWRYWGPLKAAIRRTGSFFASKATEFRDKLLEFCEWLEDEFYLLTDPIKVPYNYTSAMSRPNSGRNALLVAWERVQPRLELSLSGAREQAAATMLAVPLLVTAASPQLASIRSQYATTKTASVVINSSPSITITASDCHDLEQRVLAALKEHQEGLYAQWCRELQRRQRTEF